jgi:prophage regulatory protein
MGYAMKNKPALIRLSEVIKRTGYCRAWIYRLMKNDDFPKSIKIGTRSIAFIESEVEDWIIDRISQSRNSKDISIGNDIHQEDWNYCEEVEPNHLETVIIYLSDIKAFNMATYLGDGKYRWLVDKFGKGFYCKPSHWMKLPKRPRRINYDVISKQKMK